MTTLGEFWATKVPERDLPIPYVTKPPDHRAPTLYVTVGAPGSKKTTLAEKMLDRGEVQGRVNRDQLRRDLYDMDAPLPQHMEDAVTRVQDAHVGLYLACARDVIVDDTNAKPGDLARWLGIAHAWGAHLVVLDCTQVSVLDCLRNVRDRHRNGGRDVPAAVIRHLHQLAEAQMVWARSEWPQMVPA